MLRCVFKWKRTIRSPVQPPTAHKTLQALQQKGYLIADRTSDSGYFVRLIERGGTQEIVLRVPVMGLVSRIGEVYCFPELLGEFPAILAGVQQEDVFALLLTKDIPQADMEENDIIIFDKGKKPQPGDICICILGNGYLLVRITRKTFDSRMLSFEGSQDYPLTEGLSDPDRDQRLHYEPLAYTEENEEFFLRILEHEGFTYFPLSNSFIVATALRLVRVLSFP